MEALHIAADTQHISELELSKPPHHGGDICLAQHPIPHKLRICKLLTSKTRRRDGHSNSCTAAGIGKNFSGTQELDYVI